MQQNSIYENAKKRIDTTSPEQIESLTDSVFDYSTMYNFSPIRRNIISWYDFGDSCNILEIGGFTGAVTEELVNKGNVTVLESKAEYRDLLNKRFENRNINIISSLNECSSKYDVITIIGSLGDYACNNESEFLSSLKSLLSENGKILIAVDNSLSVSRLSGRSNGISTEKQYTKNELTDIIERAKIGSPRFMYPSPDYKFTNVIFSDDRLPDQDTIKRRLVYSPDFHYIGFDENKYLSNVLAENPSLFTELTDSFLVEISTGAQLPLPNMVCYSIYRKPEKSICTALYDDKVTKNSVSSVGQSHIDLLKNNVEILKSINPDTPDYIENGTICSTICDSKTFEIHLIDVLNTQGECAMMEEAGKFFRFVESICGTGTPDEDIFDHFGIDVGNTAKNNFNYVKYGFIDMIFQNCFFDDGKYRFFDQEWLYTNSPLEYIIFRAIYSCPNIDTNLKDKMYSYFGITEYCSLFEKLELAFSDSVRSSFYRSWFALSCTSTTEYAKLITESYNEEKEKNNALIAQQEVLGHEIAVRDLKNSELKECVFDLAAAVNESTCKHFKRRLTRKPAIHKAITGCYDYSRVNTATDTASKRMLEFQKQMSFDNPPSLCAVFQINNDNFVNAKECIASVLNQTYQAETVIILDTNGVFSKKAAKFTGKYSKILYFGNRETDKYYDCISSGHYDFVVTLPSIPINSDTFFNLASSTVSHNDAAYFIDTAFGDFPSIASVKAYKKDYYLSLSRNNETPVGDYVVFGKKTYDGRLTDTSKKIRNNVKICAGMVLLNADFEKTVANAENILNQVDMLFFSDNGSDNIDRFVEYFKDNKKTKFILNDTNLGIAHALNEILGAAHTNNYDWVLTLDQDTQCDSNMINVYSRYIHDTSLGIISPFIIHRGRLSVDDYKRMPLYETEYIPDFDRCITSASLTNVKAAVQCGGFNDELFIDAVDFDFNQRLLMNNYRLLKANDTFIVQEIGNRIPLKKISKIHNAFVSKSKKRTIYFSVHADFRLYYMARNYKWFMKKYKVTSPTVNRWYNFRDMFNRFLLYPRGRSRIQMFKAVRKGKKDANRMKY